MTSRKRIRQIVNREKPDRVGFWMGNPHEDSWPALVDRFAPETAGEETTTQHASVRHYLNDDFAWITPEWTSYKHPHGRPMFHIGAETRNLGAPGVFSQTESVKEVDEYPWPDPEYLDFSDTIEELSQTESVYRASGFWSPFFHIVSDLFGMESYFVKMYTHPDVVHAVTKRVVDFYVEANRRFFKAAGNLIDAFFFGNDFGTQIDLLISPEAFDEFVFPYFRQLTRCAKDAELQVILHSCGSIHKVIPRLIDLEVDALHPLQAKAENMSAERLGADFRGAIAFIGGVDTQDLLVNATPSEVEADVHRVREHLGPHLVVSPSHEALLPNVPPLNVEAMSRAALD